MILDNTIEIAGRVAGKLLKAGKVRFKRTVRSLNKAKNLRFVGYVVLATALILPMTIVSAAPSSPLIVAATNSVASTTPMTTETLTPAVAETSTAHVITIELTSSSPYLDAQAAKQVADAKAAQLALAQRTVTAVTVADPGQSAKLALAQKAASAFGIDWRVLAAVWQVESGQQWQTAERSYAGAQGPCQFLPSTWRSYAIDGNGDGLADINSAQDCLFGASKLLASNGAASGNVTRALLSYNHSMAYVNKVLGLAQNFG